MKLDFVSDRSCIYDWGLAVMTIENGLPENYYYMMKIGSLNNVNFFVVFRQSKSHFYIYRLENQMFFFPG